MEEMSEEIYSESLDVRKIDVKKFLEEIPANIFKKFCRVLEIRDKTKTKVLNRVIEISIDGYREIARRMGNFIFGVPKEGKEVRILSEDETKIRVAIFVFDKISKIGLWGVSEVLKDHPNDKRAFSKAVQGAIKNALKFLIPLELQEEVKNQWKEKFYASYIKERAMVKEEVKSVL